MRAISRAALGCLILLAISDSPALGELPTAEPTTRFTFTDSEVVTINTRGGDDSGAILKKPRLVTLGQQTFLVGEQMPTPAGPAEWRVGLQVWIPVKDVVQIVEYATVAEYEKRMHEYSTQQLRRGGEQEH